jgi:hypothetical protein
LAEINSGALEENLTGEGKTLRKSFGNKKGIFVGKAQGSEKQCESQ